MARNGAGGNAGSVTIKGGDDAAGSTGTDRGESKSLGNAKDGRKG